MLQKQRTYRGHLTLGNLTEEELHWWMENMHISASKTEDLQGSFNFGKFNRRGTSLVDGKYEVLQQQKNSTTGTSHD